MTPWLQRAARHGGAILAASIFIGLLAPPLASLLRPGVTLYIAVLLYLAMLRIPLRQVDATRRRLVGLAALWLLLATPLLAWLVARALPLPPSLVVPVVLMASVPPILSAPALALLLRLDAPLMLGIVAGLTLVCPLTLALVPALLPELPGEVQTADLLARALLLIGGALAAAALTRCWAGAARLQQQAPGIDALGLAMLSAFGIGIMDGFTAALLGDTARVLGIVALVFAANLTLQLGGALAFLPWGGRTAATLAFASGNRNMGLWVAVLPLASGSDTMLYIAAAQFPIYILPALLGPVYARLAGEPTTMEDDTCSR